MWQRYQMEVVADRFCGAAVEATAAQIRWGTTVWKLKPAHMLVLLWWEDHWQHMWEEQKQESKQVTALCHSSHFKIDNCFMEKLFPGLLWNICMLIWHDFMRFFCTAMTIMKEHLFGTAGGHGWINQTARIHLSVSKQPRAVVPVSIVRGLVDRCLLDHLVGVDGHGGAHALVRALQAVIVGSEYVHLAGHPGWGEVCQVLAALLLLVDLALVAIVAAVSRLRTATKTRTKDKKQTENHTVQPGPASAGSAEAVPCRFSMRAKETFLPVFKDQRRDQGCDNHDERHSDCDYLVNCQTCKKHTHQKKCWVNHKGEFCCSLLFFCA